MITVPELAAEALGSFLSPHMSRRFGSRHANLTELIPSAARLALERIGNSDALYHNVEHTMLVTLVGYDILRGRSLLTPTSASDDANGGKVRLPRGSSDAALMPYHVERSKLFVMDRFVNSKLLDVTRISDAIEFTRFPISQPDARNNEEGLLVRAANLIGQLGDPHYLRKVNALFYEFEEIGITKQFGYDTPTDLRDLYPQPSLRS